MSPQPQQQTWNKTAGRREVEKTGTKLTSRKSIRKVAVEKPQQDKVTMR